MRGPEHVFGSGSGHTVSEAAPESPLRDEQRVVPSAAA